jgi:hypothetical protein
MCDCMRCIISREGLCIHTRNSQHVCTSGLSTPCEYAVGRSLLENDVPGLSAIYQTLPSGSGVRYYNVNCDMLHPTNFKGN